ncbi:hypothetical protein [Corynebacterium mastitidis]|uniref:hypothetical protein n=1 Tax=Corynebacterium mastitidis TaxID=161890 RepID=UPI0003A1ADA1|nr:hypothetical protein [Corynebacterium mastitidis]
MLSTNNNVTRKILPFVILASIIFSLLALIAPAYAADEEESINAASVSMVLDGGESDDGAKQRRIEKSINQGMKDIASGNLDTQEARNLITALGTNQSQDNETRLANLARYSGEDDFNQLLNNQELQDQLINTDRENLEGLIGSIRQLNDEAQDAESDLTSDLKKAGEQLARGETMIPGADLANRILRLGSDRGLVDAPHTESDLLASALFSKARGADSADEISLSMDDLRKFGGDDGVQATYGQMRDPSANAQETAAGRNLAAYLQALYGYGWIVTTGRAGNEHNEFANAYGERTPIFQSDWKANATWAGELGAKLFDAATGLIIFLSDQVTKNLNPMNWFGFTGAGSEDDGWVSRSIRSILNTVGLGKSTIAAGQFLMLTLFITAFTVVLLWALRKGRFEGRSPAMKANLVRIFVILSTIPLFALLTSTVATIGLNYESEAKDEVARGNEKYIVDTLAWASTANLSLGLAGYSWSDNPQDYMPSKETVARLSKAVNSQAEAAGMRGLLESTHGETQAASAGDMLSKLNSKETISVQQYFSAITRAGSSDVVGSASGNIAAANIRDVNAQIGDTDAKKYDDDILGATLNTPYFFVEIASDDTDEDTTSSSTTSTSEDNPDVTDGPDGFEQGTRIELGAGGPNAQYFDLASRKMAASPVKWNNPATYIYGAVPAGGSVEETNTYDNYIFGEKSHQNWNPETAALDSDPDKKKLLNTNAYSIGMMNRYAGIRDFSGMMSLSTQSTAFVLQSNISSGTLEYKGFQTNPNSTGSAKNTGRNGTEFIRYVIPHTGYGDLGLKVASLSTNSITLAAIALTAFIGMLRAPIILALFEMLRGLGRSLFLGHPDGVMRAAIYFLAMRLSFAFAMKSIEVANSILQGLMGGISAITGIENMGMDYATREYGDLVTGGLKTDISHGVGGLILVVLGLGLAALVCFPMFKMTDSKGQIRKYSVVTMMVTLPYMIADQAASSMDRFNIFLGLKPQATTGVTGGNLKAITLKEHGSRFLTRTVGGAALAAGAASVGAKAGGKFGTAVAHKGGEIGKKVLGLGNNAPNPEGTDSRATQADTQRLPLRDGQGPGAPTDSQAPEKKGVVGKAMDAVRGHTSEGNEGAVDPGVSAPRDGQTTQTDPGSAADTDTGQEHNPTATTGAPGMTTDPQAPEKKGVVGKAMDAVRGHTSEGNEGAVDPGASAPRDGQTTPGTQRDNHATTGPKTLNIDQATINADHARAESTATDISGGRVNLTGNIAEAQANDVPPVEVSPRDGVPEPTDEDTQPASRRTPRPDGGDRVDHKAHIVNFLKDAAGDIKHGDGYRTDGEISHGLHHYAEEGSIAQKLAGQYRKAAAWEAKVNKTPDAHRDITHDASRKLDQPTRSSHGTSGSQAPAASPETMKLVEQLTQAVNELGRQGRDERRRDYENREALNRVSESIRRLDKN